MRSPLWNTIDIIVPFTYHIVYLPSPLSPVNQTIITIVNQYVNVRAYQNGDVI